MFRRPPKRTLLELIVLPQEMGRPVFGPPEVPADRLAALRAALDALVGDHDVLAEAQKSQIEIHKPMRGVNVAALVDRLHKVPLELHKKAAAAQLTDDVAKPASAKQ
jgi:tripartite-type tricarboxylate transporter receptor subunit TctC